MEVFKYDFSILVLSPQLLYKSANLQNTSSVLKTCVDRGWIYDTEVLLHWVFYVVDYLHLSIPRFRGFRLRPMCFSLIQEVLLPISL